ncbi:MAG: transposase [Candidatus Marinimicrobia bacterium]|nr:transposase [Candidatus Neomarinimicrobiota bacterium]
MGTYTRILYQIVFHTQHWEPTLTKRNREKLFAFIAGILIKKNCFVYQVGGIEDHIHIATHVHPVISVSGLVKDIKLACVDLIRTEKLFPHFKAWDEGFGAFTYTPEAQKNLIQYVLNQEIHHKHESAREEYLRLLREFNIEFEEKYI